MEAQLPAGHDSAGPPQAPPQKVEEKALGVSSQSKMQGLLQTQTRVCLVAQSRLPTSRGLPNRETGRQGTTA